MSDPLPSAEDEILSDLAHKLVDQVALYGLAKEIAQTPKIMDAIQSAKEARGLLLQEINGRIWLHGISPIEQQTKLGAARKAFERLRSLSEKDDQSALAEVERGEDYLHERVSKAVDDERLEASTRNYLQTVLSRIATTREEIAQLRRV